MSSDDTGIDLAQQAVETQSAPAEKMLSQSEVNKLVGAAKARAEAEAMAKYQQMQAQSAPSFGGVAQAPQSIPYDRDEFVSEARKVAQEIWDKKEQERAMAEQEARIDKWARGFDQKMRQGPALYKDFDEVVADISPEAFPNVVIMAGRADNTADIMYELGQHPDKAVRLQQMAQLHPQLAEKEFGKLVESITQNKLALSQNQRSPAPLSKLKSSVIAGSDTGKRSIRDIRKDPRFRG